MRDLHNNIRVKRLISPVAAGTTGTGKTSAASLGDRTGYAGVEFVFNYGTLTATGAVVTVTVLEGDVTGTMTSIADADLIGTETLASLLAATPRTSGTTKNVSKRLGYKGLKKYVQAKMVNTVTAAIPVSCDLLLYNPTIGPTANP
jgi:hypothetical protein